MKRLLVLELMVLFLSRHADARNGTSRSRQSFVIRYKHGEEVIPVTVTLDFSRQTVYVMNMAPRAAEKSMTFYDFKQRVITYKDLKTKYCFLARMIHESLDKERDILETMQSKVIPDQSTMVLSATEGSLSPTAVKNLAGERTAIFCRGMTTTLVSTQPHSLRRSKRQTGHYVHRSYKHYGQQTNTYTQYGHETYVVGGHRDVRDQVTNPGQVATHRSLLPSQNGKKTFMKNVQNRTPVQAATRPNPHQWPLGTRQYQAAPVQGIRPSLYSTQRTIIGPPPPTPPPPPPPLQILPGPEQATVREKLQMDPSRSSHRKYSSHPQVSVAQKGKSRQLDRVEDSSLPFQYHVAQVPSTVSGASSLYQPQNLYHPRQHFKNGIVDGSVPKQGTATPFRSEYTAPLEGHMPFNGVSFRARIEPLPADVDPNNKHSIHEERFLNLPSKDHVQELDNYNSHYNKSPARIPDESRHSLGIRKYPVASDTFPAPQYSTSPQHVSPLLDNHPVIPDDIHVEVIPAINASSPLWTFSRGVYSPSLSNISDILGQHGVLPTATVSGGGLIISGDSSRDPTEEQHAVGREAVDGKAFDPPEHLVRIPNTVPTPHEFSISAAPSRTRLLPHQNQFNSPTLLPAEVVSSNEVISPGYHYTDALLGKPIEVSHVEGTSQRKPGFSPNLTIVEGNPSATGNVWNVPSEEISEETVVFYPDKFSSVHNNEVPPSTLVRRIRPPEPERVKYDRKPTVPGKIRSWRGRQQHRSPQAGAEHGRNSTSLRSRGGKSVSFLQMQSNTSRDPTVGLGGQERRHGAVVGESRFKISQGRRHYNHRLKSRLSNGLPPGVSVHPRHPSAPYSEMVAHPAKQAWISHAATTVQEKIVAGRRASKLSPRRRSGNQQSSCCHRKLHLVRPTATTAADTIHHQIGRSSPFSCCRKGRRRHNNLRHSVMPCCQEKSSVLQDEPSPLPSLSSSEQQTRKSCSVDQTCSIVYRTVGQVKICRAVGC